MGRHKNLGEHIKKLMDNAGLSVREFADAIEAHKDTPQKWFRGESYPRPKYHRRMAEALKVSIPFMLMKKETISLEANLPAPIMTATARKEDNDMDAVLMKSFLQRLDMIDSKLIRLDGMDSRISSIEKEIRNLRDFPLTDASRPKIKQ